VYGTASKDVGDEAIGPARLDEVARSVSIPVVGIGGVTPARAAELARTRAAGVAVLGVLMTSDAPGRTTRALLRPFEARAGGVGEVPAEGRR
jgi:thiamine-phosphate pyrophosphorylase